MIKPDAYIRATTSASVAESPKLPRLDSSVDPVLAALDKRIEDIKANIAFSEKQAAKIGSDPATGPGKRRVAAMAAWGLSISAKWPRLTGAQRRGIAKIVQSTHAIGVGSASQEILPMTARVLVREGLAMTFGTGEFDVFGPFTYITDPCEV